MHLCNLFWNCPYVENFCLIFLGQVQHAYAVIRIGNTNKACLLSPELQSPIFGNSGIGFSPDLRILTLNPNPTQSRLHHGKKYHIIKWQHNVHFLTVLYDYRKGPAMPADESTAVPAGLMISLNVMSMTDFEFH